MILRTAGLATRYKERYDSPMATRLIGCHIHQEDDPWWVGGALGWLAMYDNIAQCPGKVGDNYRPILEEKLRRDPPEFLYKLHKRFIAACEAEAAKNA